MKHVQGINMCNLIAKNFQFISEIVLLQGFQFAFLQQNIQFYLLQKTPKFSPCEMWFPFGKLLRADYYCHSLHLLAATNRAHTIDNCNNICISICASIIIKRTHSPMFEDSSAKQHHSLWLPFRILSIFEEQRTQNILPFSAQQYTHKF